MGYSMAFHPILFLFLFFLIPFHSVTAINVPSDISSKNSLLTIIPQPNPTLIPHDALIVTSDFALSSLASSNHWSGNGTSSNPFIISNYYINYRNFGTTGIFLGNITQFVIIKDNYLLSTENGSVGEINNLYGSY